MCAYILCFRVHLSIKSKHNESNSGIESLLLSPWLTVKMKNNSTNTAPKGRIPAIRELKKKEKSIHTITTEMAYDLRKERMEVPHLFRDLSWDLVGSHRMFIRLLSITKVKASEGERE